MPSNNFLHARTAWSQLAQLTLQRRVILLDARWLLQAEFALDGMLVMNTFKPQVFLVSNLFPQSHLQRLNGSKFGLHIHVTHRSICFLTCNEMLGKVTELCCWRSESCRIRGAEKRFRRRRVVHPCIAWT